MFERYKLLAFFSFFALKDHPIFHIDLQILITFELGWVSGILGSASDYILSEPGIVGNAHLWYYLLTRFFNLK